MEQQLKIFKIIHLALIAGLILAYYFLGDLGNLTELTFPTVNSKSYIYLFIPIAAFIVSNLLFKHFVSKIDNNLSVQQKLVSYQSASIIRWAILEGAAFLILLIYPEFLLFGILLIVYLALLIPTEARIKRDLNQFD
ncbi:MFS transporter [Mesoflavibacter sp. CH_XMU1422-2]|uniref:MFS transporter n=1 Tax=Mesoflavibacter sp. CH_XMU1422-2 TaxID=3107770 RepID=UPI0030084EC8